MAEFQEVMRQYKRMCYGKACSDCDFYKFKMSLSHQMACLRFLKEYPVEAEALVMNGAAEHPEPVYPTWVEYLVGIGVIPHEIRLETEDALMDTHLLKPIPADIAQKLGIEPKEG